MKTRAALIVVVLVGCLILGIGIAQATDYWKTESSKVPIKIQEGEFAGESDPGDIRGSYSFGDIEAAFGIPPEIMAAAFMMAGENPGIIKAKDLETLWGEQGDGTEICTDSIRLFTSLWTGLPHSPEETTVLPSSAVEILLAYDKIDQDLAADLASTAVEAAAPPAMEEASLDTPAADDDHEVPERMVRGLTTFGDLRKWGVSEEAWLGETGLPMGGRATALKDWASENGLAMSELKTSAQNLVDASE